MSLFTRKKRYFGLDIGDSSVKAIELTISRNAYEVVNLAVIPTPRGITDREINAVALRAALEEEINLPKKGDLPRALCAVESDKVLIRHVVFPAMPEKELAEAVRFESEAQFPIPAEDLVVDYVKVRDFNEGGIRKQEVMLVAARRGHVRELTELIRCIGLEPEAVDIEPLALARVTALFEPGEKKMCYAMVNIGSSSTGLFVFADNILRFMRVLPTGGEIITDALVSGCGISREAAETVKKTLDLTGESHLKQAALSQKTEAVKFVVQKVINEIRRNIEFYLTNQKDLNLEKIFLTGGGALLKGLDTMCSERFGIPTVILNPLEKLKLSSKLKPRVQELNEAGAALTVAVGLALK